MTSGLREDKEWCPEGACASCTVEVLGRMADFASPKLCYFAGPRWPVLWRRLCL